MSDTIEPTPAETSVLAELFSTTRRQSNLAILRAHVAAEVAKATGELLKDKERLDWLERNLMSLFHDRSSVSMDGMRVQGQLYNEARGTRGGPSFFRVHHRTIRDALDAARAQQKDTP